MSASDSLPALQRLERDPGDLKKQLAIIRISEPISDVGDASSSPSKRGSDVSVSNLNDPTPASLEADLSHYKVRRSSSPVGRPTDLKLAQGTIFETAILLP